MKRFTATMLMMVFLISSSVLAIEKTPITVWFYTGSPQVREWAKEFEGEFNAANPDIDLSFDIVTWQAVRETVSVAAASGSGPDIAYMSANLIPAFATNGLTLPLNNYLDKWSGKQDFIPSLLTSVTDENGNVNAMPFAMWSIFDLYNMDVLTSSGVPIPKNWDELLSSVRKMTKVSADNTVITYGYAAPQKPDYAINSLHLAMEQLGKGLIYMGDDRADISNDRGRKAVSYLRDLWQAGMPDNSTGASRIRGSVSGSVAINGWGSYNVLDVASQDSSHLEPRRVVGPRVGQDSVRFNSGAIYILRTSKHPDEAWRVISSFLEPSTHEDFIRVNRSYLPVRKSVLSRVDQVVEHPLVAKMTSLMYEPMTHYGAVHNYWTSVWPVGGDIILKVLQGTAGLEGALEDAERAMNEVLAEELGKN